MKRLAIARRARWIAIAALALGAFEACSNSGDSTPGPPNGPPDIALGLPLEALACDNSLVVHLTLTNWDLLPPGKCGSDAQCGSVRVSLLETEDGPPLASQRAATADVQLDLGDLVAPKNADDPSLSQVHFIKAELIGDSLQPFVINGEGHSSDEQPVSLLPPPACSSEGGASSGGAAGASTAGATSGGGAAGVSSSQGGSGGSAGSVGDQTGGSGGSGELGAGGEGATAGTPPL